MRVISGKYRGRKLNSPINNDIRPTTDKVKEAIFNIVQLRVEDACVLDLFAGSGALGIEALSRGAKKVYFCENSSKSLDLLMSNLAFCDKSCYEVYKGDYTDCLRLLASKNVKIDIVLCDPPYSKKLGEQVLDRLQKHDLLAPNGTIIVERKTDDAVVNSHYFDKLSTRTYGDTTLEIFSLLSKIAITGTFDPFTYGHKDLVIKALEDFDKVYVVVLNNPDKVMSYTVEDRLKMIELSLEEYKKRVVIEYYQGMTVDYCNLNGIKYILRGVRNDRDFDYERKMAEYNKENGGIETIFMSAIKEISSTEVRAKVKSSQSVHDMVVQQIIPILHKIL